MRPIILALLLCGVAHAEAPGDALEAKRQKIRGNAKAMGLIFGAEFCMAQEVRRAALAEIGKEKKYARIGGYENKAKMYFLQTRIRRADELIEKERGVLKASFKKVKPASCTSDGVKGIIACKNAGDDPPAACLDEDVALGLELVETVDDGAGDDE